ncbi:hypothetical protein [Bradyrhizobium sp. RT5a]|uniref:hypothetical protein n=1 Tax=unclassified Bradyrhizobium TaxID=2631580 RepID=UPI00339376CE
MAAVQPAAMPLPAFRGYSKTLSSRGGLLITYTDKASSVLVDMLRLTGWLVTVGVDVGARHKLTVGLGFGASLSVGRRIGDMERRKAHPRQA